MHSRIRPRSRVPWTHVLFSSVANHSLRAILLQRRKAQRPRKKHELKGVNADWKNRIATGAETLAGPPRANRTRISFELMRARGADGWSSLNILISDPSISLDNVLAAEFFAAEISTQQGRDFESITRWRDA